jgi:hypothetical protein
MLETRAQRIFCLIAVSLIFVLTAIAQKTTPASTCQGVGCSGLSRAELFIKTFAGSKALRTSQLEQEEQVRLAFYGIDATRAEVEAGRLTEKEGKFITDGHEQVIRDYVHDKGNEAKILASTGQVSDIPTINKSLGKLLGVARQDALMGREELAQRAQAEMVKVLTTFSQEFAATCQKQKYPVETALMLMRQNELMGTGISLDQCLSRKVSTELSSQGVNYRFESCSDLSLSPKKWDLKISGRITGLGKGDEASWEAKFLWKRYQTEMGGEMEIFKEIVEIEEESVKVPDDGGPKAKPNGWLQSPVSNSQIRKIQVLKMRIAPLYLMGEHGVSGNSSANSVEADIKSEDEPCNSII